MARAHLLKTITDSAGNIRPGAVVRVLVPNTNDLIPDRLWAADTGTTQLSNPVVAVDGVVDFYLDVPRRVSLGVRVGNEPEKFFHGLDVIMPLPAYHEHPYAQTLHTHGDAAAGPHTHSEYSLTTHSHTEASHTHAWPVSSVNGRFGDVTGLAEMNHFHDTTGGSARSAGRYALATTDANGQFTVVFGKPLPFIPGAVVVSTMGQLAGDISNVAVPLGFVTETQISGRVWGVDTAGVLRSRNNAQVDLYIVAAAEA